MNGMVYETVMHLMVANLGLLLCVAVMYYVMRVCTENKHELSVLVQLKQILKHKRTLFLIEMIIPFFPIIGMWLTHFSSTCSKLSPNRPQNWKYWRLNMFHRHN